MTMLLPISGATADLLESDKVMITGSLNQTHAPRSERHFWESALRAGIRNTLALQQCDELNIMELIHVSPDDFASSSSSAYGQQAEVAAAQILEGTNEQRTKNKAWGNGRRLIVGSHEANHKNGNLRMGQSTDHHLSSNDNEAVLHIRIVLCNKTDPQNRSVTDSDDAPKINNASSLRARALLRWPQLTEQVQSAAVASGISASEASAFKLDHNFRPTMLQQTVVRSLVDLAHRGKESTNPDMANPTNKPQAENVDATHATSWNLTNESTSTGNNTTAQAKEHSGDHTTITGRRESLQDGLYLGSLHLPMTSIEAKVGVLLVFGALVLSLCFIAVTQLDRVRRWYFPQSSSTLGAALQDNNEVASTYGTNVNDFSGDCSQQGAGENSAATNTGKEAATPNIEDQGHPAASFVKSMATALSWDNSRTEAAKPIKEEELLLAEENGEAERIPTYRSPSQVLVHKQKATQDATRSQFRGIIML